MESLIANQKRKKRKSRNRLNAIRKKALQNVIVNNSHVRGCDVTTNNKNNFCTHKASICITSNRLTLFNKAVTSETVSRTNISEFKNKIYSKDYKKEYVNIVAKLMLPLNRQVTNVLTTNCDNQKGGSVPCVTKQCNNDELSCKTRSSMVLCSPSHQPEDIDISKIFQINRDQSDHVLREPSSINNSFNETKFYNDFMNKIPSYLKKTAPMLLNTDFVHKCKMSLRYLYMENDHLNIKDYSTSWSDFSYKYSSQESILQNPTDYIEYSYQAVSKPDLISSPLHSIVSNSTIRLSSSSLSTVVSDSPEYIYYPHKLNQ